MNILIETSHHRGCVALVKLLQDEQYAFLPRKQLLPLHAFHVRDVGGENRVHLERNSILDGLLKNTVLGLCEVVPCMTRK